MGITKKAMSDDATEVYKYHELYKGKLFRYHSRHGGTVENILCDGVSVHETITLDPPNPDEGSYGNCRVVGVEVFLISDKGNVYNINEIEWYE